MVGWIKRGFIVPIKLIVCIKIIVTYTSKLSADCAAIECAFERKKIWHEIEIWCENHKESHWNCCFGLILFSAITRIFFRCELLLNVCSWICSTVVKRAFICFYMPIFWCCLFLFRVICQVSLMVRLYMKITTVPFTRNQPNEIGEKR